MDEKYLIRYWFYNNEENKYCINIEYFETQESAEDKYDNMLVTNDIPHIELLKDVYKNDKLLYQFLLMVKNSEGETLFK